VQSGQPPGPLDAEATLCALYERIGPLATRLALAITFIWFGAMKLAHVSPVSELVARAIPLAPPHVVVPALGAFEIIVGLGLLARRTLRWALVAFFVHMLGTFSVFFRMPDLAYQAGNPLLLTTLGEFVIKNVVLLAAGVMVAGTMGRAQRSRPEAPLA